MCYSYAPLPFPHLSRDRQSSTNLILQRAFHWAKRMDMPVRSNGISRLNRHWFLIDQAANEGSCLASAIVSLSVSTYCTWPGSVDYLKNKENAPKGQSPPRDRAEQADVVKAFDFCNILRSFEQMMDFDQSTCRHHRASAHSSSRGKTSVFFRILPRAEMRFAQITLFIRQNCTPPPPFSRD